MRPSNIIEERQKEARRLMREMRKLWKARQDLGYIELDKPVRHGWFKHLTLRDDIARRKDAPVFRRVLELSGIEIWGRDKQHADKLWKSRQNRNGVVQYPGMRKLSQKHFKRLSPRVAKWYEGFEWHYRVGEGNTKRYYCRVPSYFFVPTYTKAYITKRQIVDPDIESRLSEIDRILTSNEYYGLYEWNYWHRRNDKPFNFHRRLRHRVKNALADYDEANFDRQVYQKIDW